MSQAKNPEETEEVEAIFFAAAVAVAYIAAAAVSVVAAAYSVVTKVAYWDPTVLNEPLPSFSAGTSISRDVMIAELGSLLYLRNNQ